MAAKISWNSPYIGDFPARLLADITSHVKESYAHGLGSIGAMIQSSGTGKSRTMHEIAAKVFTIPINIRQTESGDVGAGSSFSFCPLPYLTPLQRIRTQI